MLKRLRDRLRRKPKVVTLREAIRREQKELKDKVWKETQRLVVAIPNCRVSTFMFGECYCVQIRIDNKFGRLSIPVHEIATMPEDFMNMQILQFLRHAKIVKNYWEKRDRAPQLP